MRGVLGLQMLHTKKVARRKSVRTQARKILAESALNVKMLPSIDS